MIMSPENNIELCGEAGSKIKLCNGPGSNIKLCPLPADCLYKVANVEIIGVDHSGGLDGFRVSIDDDDVTDLESGDVITVYDSPGNDGDYTVNWVELVVDPVEETAWYVVYVNEEIPVEAAGGHISQGPMELAIDGYFDGLIPRSNCALGVPCDGHPVWDGVFSVREDICEWSAGVGPDGAGFCMDEYRISTLDVFFNFDPIYPGPWLLELRGPSFAGGEGSVWFGRKDFGHSPLGTYHQTESCAGDPDTLDIIIPES